MKRFILWALLLFSPLFLSPVYAFNPSNDDDDDEEEILVLVSTTEEGQNGNRGFAFIPMEVSFSRLHQTISIHFLLSEGPVTITITNLTNGSYSNYLVDSGCGSTWLPLPANEGIYRIDFCLDDGTCYYGLFVL